MIFCLALVQVNDVEIERCMVKARRTRTLKGLHDDFINIQYPFQEFLTLAWNIVYSKGKT